jgi:hypothetical protein
MALESFSALERDSRTRHDSDVQLSYAMYLVVGILTLGIYAIYVQYKLIARQQDHFRRMGRFAGDLVRLIAERAKETGSAQSSAELVEVRALSDDFQRFQRGKERSAALWTILSIVTLGLAMLYVLYFLNADLVRHQRLEADFIERSSTLLTKLGVGQYPIEVEHVVPNRNYAVYLLLTVITLGLFELYWVYVRIKDPNEHFKEHERFEDQLIATIRPAT